MTHTLHREGTIDDLKKDFVVLAMPTQKVTVEGSKEKLQKFYQLGMKYNPVNMGGSKEGNIYTLDGQENVIKSANDGSICHVVFNNVESVILLLKDLKKEDLGLSITVSGLMDSVDQCCEEAGLHRHTVNMSLGIFGKTEKLPSEEIREITTMCGHGMVTAALVLDVVDKIKSGRLTTEEASEKLGATCLCGIFNADRSAILLERMAKK